MEKARKLILACSCNPKPGPSQLLPPGPSLCCWQCCSAGWCARPGLQTMSEFHNLGQSPGQTLWSCPFCPWLCGLCKTLIL